MGNVCQSDLPKETGVYDPTQLDFQRTHPIALSPHYGQLLDRISIILLTQSKYLHFRMHVKILVSNGFIQYSMICICTEI